MQGFGENREAFHTFLYMSCTDEEPEFAIEEKLTSMSSGQLGIEGDRWPEGNAVG